MKIDLIAGARPNFIKILPIIEAINNIDKTGVIKYRLIHTGQHYDSSMSDTFFKQLKIPRPNFNLQAGSGSHAVQTARIMTAYEKLLLNEKPEYCLVVGDVNSTLACSIVAKKAHIKVIHVEAGIRSKDLAMPEEINRIVTDSLTDIFFTTSVFANKNLRKMGIPTENIYFVGNTMIDTLIRFKPRFKKPFFWDEYNLSKKNFFVVTLHRPSNVDDSEKLESTLLSILQNSRKLPIILPAHPRTQKQLLNLKLNYDNIFVVKPLSYLEFNYLVENSKAVITDSGGITEETTALNIPCMTIRENTERPETVSIGTNELLGSDPNAIGSAFSKLFNGNWKKGTLPELWDGKTAERIIKILMKFD